MSSSTLGLLVIVPTMALMLYAFWRLVRRAFSRRGAKRMLCVRCGEVARPKIVTPGSMAVELLLWCLMIVPGVIYGLVRGSRRREVCPSCGSGELIPENSPRAKLLAQGRPSV
ncbi:MAG: hypothetical protein KGI52_07425 [Burkholderiales bacterium]|nr:hypothetical protein [Burkholderiales bacterium]